MEWLNYNEYIYAIYILLLFFDIFSFSTFSGGSWAISLIWAMMILPLADALQNCLQDLTSRIAQV